jgi:hypothetical protein
VGHPRLLPDRELDLHKDLGMILGERLIDCLARRMRQRLLRKKILFGAWMAEFAAALSKTHCRDEHMDVRMKGFGDIHSVPPLNSLVTWLLSQTAQTLPNPDGTVLRLTYTDEKKSSSIRWGGA